METFRHPKKDGLSAMDNRNRAGQISAKSIRRHGYQKAFHKCLSSLLPWHSTHLHYHAHMRIFSLCVCPSLFHYAVSYLIPQHKKVVKSYCFLSLKSPSPLPVLIFTSYVCLASYITILKFNALCKMRHSQFLSHRTDGKIK